LVGTGTEGKNKHTVINRTVFSEAEKRGNLRRICDLTISLPTKASRNNTLFSLGLSRKGGGRSFGAAQTLNALHVLKCMKRKEERLMLKRFIRWILPLMVLVLIATYFVLSPMVAGHAAGHVTPSHITAPQFLFPDMFSRGH
jgi:hypothetical protein